MTRREVLRQSAVQAGAMWAMLGQTHSHDDIAAPSGGFRFFTPEQAIEVEAIAAQIIPADETGGAREAGVIRFIDLNLATYESDKQAAYTRGLKILAERSRWSLLRFGPGETDRGSALYGAEAIRRRDISRGRAE